jgi:hypothetical protein
MGTAKIILVKNEIRDHGSRMRIETFSDSKVIFFTNILCFLVMRYLKAVTWFLFDTLLFIIALTLLVILREFDCAPYWT